jgi:hypothetical protein
LAGILPKQYNGRALGELLLLESGAADTGPSLCNDVLLVVWFRSLAQADIVNPMLILRVLSSAQK